MHQLVSDIKNLKSKHKDLQVPFKAILANSKKEIYIRVNKLKICRKLSASISV